MALTELLKESVKRAKKGKGNYTVPVDLPEGFRLDKEGELVLPSKAAQCADLLYRTREARLAVQRHCEVLERAENKLREYFIENLGKSDATGIAGAVARVQIEVKLVPQVADWTALYAYVKRTGAFELLQRRLKEEAVKERWDDHKQVPGVTTFNAKKVRVTKL